MTVAHGIDVGPDPLPVRDAWVETTVRAPGEPLDLVRRAVAAAGGQDHMVYENGGEWSIAIGAVARLWVDARGVHRRARDRDVDVAWSELPGPGDPLPVLRSLLAGLGHRDWRAYGWIAFELGLARMHGARPDIGDHLVHLVVPHTEIRIAGGVARLRSTDRAGLERAAAALTEPPGGELHPTTAGRAPAVLDGHAANGHDTDGHDTDGHRARVARAVAAIGRGELDKVVLSRVVPVDTELDLAETFVAGRRANDPARSFLLSLGGLDAAGYSPEVLVRAEPSGTVLSQPLAGTRARTGHAETDARLREELRRDPKEVVEHAVSVRAVVDELGEVCDEVCVHDYMDVVERGSVQHLASRVTGRLGTGRDGWDALGAIFPTATASGIPKRAACDLIAADESEPRGLYGGAVLTVDADGTLDAALVLRSVQRRAGRTWLRAGGGIVAASHPDRELEETREKLRSVAGFLVAADQRAASGA